MTQAEPLPEGTLPRSLNHAQHDTIGMGGADGFDAVRVLDRELVLAVLRGLPQAVIDDAEFGHLDRDPVLGRVDPGDALSRRGVFDVAQAVPDQTTDIELVVDNAGAALGMAAQGGVGPQGTGRAGVPLALRRRARVRGLTPAANSLKMRRTVSASSSLMRRSPRIGSPLSSVRFTTS